MIKKLREIGYRETGSIEPVLQEEAAELVRIIGDRLDSDGIWEVDSLLLSLIAVNAAWAFMAGFRLPLDNDALLRAVEGNGRVLDAIGPTNKYTALPFLKDWFPEWSGTLEHKRLFTYMHTILRKMVRHVKAPENERHRESFIQSFLREIENPATDKKIFNGM